jgi:hypothetical protein
MIGQATQVNFLLCHQQFWFQPTAADLEMMHSVLCFQMQNLQKQMTELLNLLTQLAEVVVELTVNSTMWLL